MPLPLLAFITAFSIVALYATSKKWGRIKGYPVAILAGVIAAMLVAKGTYWYESRHPNSIESAQKYIVGTWVYAEPLTDANPGLLSWIRWEIRPDGTLIQQTAYPRDSQWGEKETLSYTVITDKFSDTGERFYGLRVGNSAMSAAIMEDGRLLVQILDSQYHGYFKRGDKDLNK